MHTAPGNHYSASLTNGDLVAELTMARHQLARIRADVFECRLDPGTQREIRTLELDVLELTAEVRRRGLDATGTSR